MQSSPRLVVSPGRSLPKMQGPSQLAAAALGSIVPLIGLTLGVLASNGCLVLVDNPQPEDLTGMATPDDEPDPADDDDDDGGDGDENKGNCTAKCELAASCGDGSASNCVTNCEAVYDDYPSCQGELHSLNGCIADLDCIDYFDYYEGDACKFDDYPCDDEDYAYYTCIGDC